MKITIKFPLQLIAQYLLTSHKRSHHKKTGTENSTCVRQIRMGQDHRTQAIPAQGCRIRRKSNVTRKTEGKINIYGER